MKPKIFKHALLAAIAVLAISTSVSAQDSLAVPPMPPVKLKMYKFKQDKALKQNMADLKVKMKLLQKQMDQKNFKMNMDMKFAFKDFDKKFSESFKDFDKSFKDFGKNFNESFKDFGKNFSGSFSEMAPNFSGDFKNLNSISYNSNSNANNEEYKQKVASGEMIEKVKTYSKSYSVDANDVLQISNSFGKVVVNTWAKKEFKVDVQMKFGADDEDYVNNMINGSSISDSKDGSIVSFKTILARNNSRHGNNHIEVNYTVYMPAGNALDLTNKFGNVVLPDISGKATLRISYGSLIAQQLTNNQNDVVIKFSQDNTSTIALFNGKSLRVEFSKFKVGVLNNVDAIFNFSDTVIDKLKGINDINVKFGDGLKINGINTATNKITASNTKVILEFKDAFNFDLTNRLGSFKYNDNVKIISKSRSDEERGWSQIKNYKGYIENDNSNSTIVINARFTEVKIM